MNELKSICEAFEQYRQRGQQTALASIVFTTGSTYRRAGARMLIADDGGTVGSISGGCLEADVVERALEVMKSGKPLVVSYDTRSNEDILWGMGLGCQGVVEVLIESLVNSTPIEILSRATRLNETCVVATVIGASANSHNVNVGDRLMLSVAGIERNQIRNTGLSLQISEDAFLAFTAGKSMMKLYGQPGEEVKVYLEVMEPPVPLVLFGAGADALPVVRFACALGWHVTVVDTRAREATKARFAEADDVILCRAEDVARRVRFSSRTVAVLMSHNYLDDMELLTQFHCSPVRYIGVLGPRKRTTRLLNDIVAQGGPEISIEDSRLHSPVGIDIGADTPEEIAVSIIAEIRAILAGRSASFLKERLTPIHTANGVSPAVGQMLHLNADDLLPHAAKRTALAVAA
ncbi:MAG: XdhC family protein [Acidobacteria bacterium]|nr:XdhC family protein [Acidobacteriota bacterium]